jgi:ATP-dependent DNA helicase RecQ
MLYWNSVVRKALLLNFFKKDIEQFGLLKMTEEGKKFLKKPVSVKVVMNHKFEEGEGDDDELVLLNAKGGNVLEPALLEMLKEIRKTVAKKHSVPTYVVFQDPSLEEMATLFPITMDELSNITGVSTGKAQRYGAAFLAAIEKYVEEHGIERMGDFDNIKSADKNSNTKINIIKAIDKRMPLEDIARSFSMNMDALVNELEAIVNSGTKVNINYYLDDEIDEDIRDEIFDYFMEAESDSVDVAYKKLKEDDIELREIQLMRIKFISEMAN